MKKKLEVIVAIVVVIVLLGIGIYLLAGKKTDKNVEPEEMAQEQQKENEEGYSLIDMNNTENVKIENGVKENISSPLLKEKTLIGLRVSNIRLVAENGMTNFTADVKNTSSTDFLEREITIVFRRKDGSELARLRGQLPDIKNGETNRIDASTTADMTNAYDFVIE